MKNDYRMKDIKSERRKALKEVWGYDILGDNGFYLMVGFLGAATYAVMSL